MKKKANYLDSWCKIRIRCTGWLNLYLTYTRVGRSDTPLQAGRPRAPSLSNRDAEPRERLLKMLRPKFTVGPMPCVRGDETALVQLFQNLINNALKFRSDRPAEIHLYSQQEGDQWHLTLMDNGIGIEAQHHDEIFAPFRRLHSASEYEGSGIGLATCRKIVAQHQGKLWVESEVGEGTTFHITLPDAASPEEGCAPIYERTVEAAYPSVSASAGAVSGTVEVSA